MVGWHHRLNGHEFEQTSGDGEGQGSLVCCSPWGRKESDMIEHTTTLEFLSSEKGKDNGIQFLTQEVVRAGHGGFLEASGSVSVSSVAQSCPTLCDLMNRNTPGLPVYHKLLEFTQTHAHGVGDAIQPSHPLSSPSPPAPNPSQHQGLFQ